RGASYKIMPGEYEESFEDVRGQKEVVESVKEVVKLFQGFRDFKKVGGYPPHGILFEGPPGTGKTLLAKALAGTVRVPFLGATGTGFSSMWLGMGNMRVMMMFRKARKFAKRYDGCVIFIDEIDAIGSRGGVAMARAEGPGLFGRVFGPGVAGGNTHPVVMGGMGGGGGGIINELLVQMDGLVVPRGLKRYIRRVFRMKKKSPSYNILIIGATNRAQDLDPALLRPGRFDRKVHVGLPDKEGRKDIIQYYLNKVRHEPIDLDKFAQVTIGYSPARIKNIVNEALIMALQDGRDALSWHDVWQAKLVDEIGLKQPVKYTEREKVMTAVHEAGHAVASRELQSKERQIQVITIIKREEALGLVHSLELEERFSRTKDDLLNEIKVSLAGMAAEEIWFGTSTSGTGGDLYNATMRTVQYIGQWGMGRRLLAYTVIPRSVYGGSDIVEHMLKDKEIKDEIDGILKQCKAEVTALLKRRGDAVERIRDELLEREELVGDQLEALMREIFEEPVAAATTTGPVTSGPIS
ncbi:MAG: AAA family ATPase, partial [Actinomycetota bacterium]